MKQSDQTIVKQFVEAHFHNFTKGRDRQKIRGIVIHTSTASLSSMDNWFRDPKAFASAHYGVGLDGTVHQYVSEVDTAFHAGVVLRPVAKLVKRMGAVNPNSYLIGIENEDLGHPTTCKRTEAMIAANVELCYRICKRYGIVPSSETIIPHRSIRADKICPGNMPVAEIIKRVVKRVAADQKPKAKTIKTPAK